MFPTRSCEIPNLVALWRADSRRSSITISRTRSLFLDVAAVEGLLDLGSTSTPSLPRFNWLTQHLSVVYSRTSSPDVPCKVSSIWDNVIPFNCRYLIASRCSNFFVFLQTQNMSTLRAWDKIIKSASNELTIQKRYKYVIYFTDKLWLSHLFAKYDRLKTFQSPLVGTSWIGTTKLMLMTYCVGQKIHLDINQERQIKLNKTFLPFQIIVQLSLRHTKRSPIPHRDIHSKRLVIWFDLRNWEFCGTTPREMDG